MLNRGETLKLRDLNAAFTEPEDDLARLLPGVAARRAHRRRRTATPGCASWCAPTARASTPTRRSRRRSNTDFDQLQAGFDQTIEQTFGAHAQARWRRRRTSKLLRDAARRAARRCADENPRSFPVQMALGARAAQGRRSSTRRCRRSSARRRWCRWPAARTARTSRSRRSRSRRRTRARAIAELTALVAVDFNNVEAARQLAGAAARRPSVDDPAKLRRSTSASPRSIRSTPRRTRCSAACALQRNDADAAAREFRTVLALGPVDRAAAYTDLAESYFKGGKRAEAKKQTLAALEIAPSYERAQDLLLKLVDGDGSEAQARRSVAAPAASRRCLHAGAGAAAARRRAAADGARRSLRRPAVALRAHQVSLHDRRHAASRRTSTASRGASTRRRPSRTCRAASRPRRRSRSRIRSC